MRFVIFGTERKLGLLDGRRVLDLFLKAGDVVEVRSDAIGSIVGRIVA